MSVDVITIPHEYITSFWSSFPLITNTTSKHVVDHRRWLFIIYTSLGGWLFLLNLANEIVDLRKVWNMRLTTIKLAAFLNPFVQR